MRLPHDSSVIHPSLLSLEVYAGPKALIVHGIYVYVALDTGLYGEGNTISLINTRNNMVDFEMVPDVPFSPNCLVTSGQYVYAASVPDAVIPIGGSMVSAIYMDIGVVSVNIPGYVCAMTSLAGVVFVANNMKTLANNMKTLYVLNTSGDNYFNIKITKIASLSLPLSPTVMHSNGAHAYAGSNLDHTIVDIGILPDHHLLDHDSHAQLEDTVIISAYSPSSTPQLGFQIDNGQVPNTIYITTTTRLNKLRFKITTNTSETMLTPGELVPEQEAQRTMGSILYLDLTNLQLTSDEFNALQFTAVQWQFKTFPADRIVAMTPTTALTLNPDGNMGIDIHIDNLGIAHPPSSASVQLRVTFYHIAPVNTGNFPLTSHFQVRLQPPPDGREDLHGAIIVDVPETAIVNSLMDDAVENHIMLRFSSGPIPHQVTASAQTVFTVTFVYADKPGLGALTTAQRAEQFSVTPSENAQHWSIACHPGVYPSWTLRPPAGTTIVGLDSQATLSFTIDHIVTDLAPGPTLMLVSYTDVPGYMDGSYSIVLQKVPHVSISSLTVTPNVAKIQDGVAHATVQWTVSDATQLFLNGMDVTGRTSYAASLTARPPYTLSLWPWRRQLRRTDRDCTG